VTGVQVRLGWLAAALAMGAAVADAVSPVSLVRVDSIAPVELAERIRAGASDLDLVDVRSVVAFEAGHIPTARNAPLTEFNGMPEAAARTVVVYGAGDEEAITAAARVRAAGKAARVRTLERGLDGWIDDIMAPRIARDVTEAERSVLAARSELSRWFGGVPRAVDASAGRQVAEPQRSTRLLGGC